MAAGHQWKHGWIPLTEAAAKEKFHGNTPKGWKPSTTEHSAPEDHADNLSKDAFNGGSNTHGALRVHAEAAKAHRKASSATSIASESTRHAEMAKLHSKVANAKMDSLDAEKKADALSGASKEQAFRKLISGQRRGKRGGKS